MRRKLLLFIAIAIPCLLMAQSKTNLQGFLVGAINGHPLEDIIVILDNNVSQAQSDDDGFFYFANVPEGEHRLTFKSVSTITKQVPATIVEGQLTDLGIIELNENNIQQDLSLVGMIDEVVADEDADISSQDVSAKVILSNDVFLNKAAYQLSPMRFRVRGYESYYEQKYINGVSFNDQNRGVFNYSSIGALNDMTRNGDVANYMESSTFTFGSIGGSENINMRASNYDAGHKATVSYTNRNYYLRAMYTYSTGLMSNGWAVTTSVGGRYSHEGNIEGTFYKNVSFALSFEKQWKGGDHSLSIVTFGSPVQRGQQGSSYQEVYDLRKNNLYNPNWGYLNGEKRNAKVVTAFDPTAIISHVWKINDKATLTTGLGMHYARYGNTALNWYDGADPRPDYYRYLPSYFEDKELSASYADRWINNTNGIAQLNWDNMYKANMLNILQGNGAAIYMVEERRSDLWENSLNSTLNAQISNRMKILAGVGARTTLSRQFKTVDDLLGAEYVLDIDKFAEQDFANDHDKLQNDLNRPDRKVYENGIFGYNFNLNIYSANAWIVNQYNGRKVDFDYGMKLTYTSFQRDGKMRNGRYPESSYGKGVRHSFTDIAVKAGLTYKINGRHYLRLNASYGSEAPLPYYSYVSPRISDKTVDLESGKILSADFSYVFSTPKVYGRISAYQTNFYDQIERASYYHDQQKTFINHVLTGVNRIHRGIEAGITYKLTSQWSFDLAGTISEYFYSNNPDGVMNSENGKIDNLKETVYMKDLYVGGIPQFAGTFGIRYFIDYWFLGANINGFGRNYVEVAPLRRIASIYSTINPNDPTDWAAYDHLTKQEKFKDGFTIDLSIGKLLYLKNGTSMNFNLSVNNILNNKDIRTGGYEQGRVNLSYPDRYTSKYFYMQGINCFANISYRF